MHQLDKPEYERVRRLYDPMDYHLALKGILDGSVLGQVYVDNPEHPQAALIRRKHRFYLAGSANDDEFNEEVRRLFAETVLPQAKASGMRMLLLYYSGASWENEIDLGLPTISPIKVWRQYYVFKRLRHDWRALPPADMTMTDVDQALLTRGELKNLDVLTEEMCSERESVEDFIARSFGVCLIRGAEIVGWCLSEYNQADACEIGIETIEAYQRRRLATATASALVERALAQGITHIGWDCFTNNIPSVRAALTIGFEKVVDYPVYLMKVE